MIARGDLGIEIPRKIPGIQRIVIRKCVVAKKPVIVATDAAINDTESAPYPRRGDRHCQCHILPHRRADAERETAEGKYAVQAVHTWPR